MTKQPKYMIGDVVFARGTTFFEWLIRVGTRSQINHVGIVYDVEDDYVVVAEAMPQGVIFSNYSHEYLNDACEVRRVVVYVDDDDKVTYYIDETEAEELKRIIEKYIGLPYDWSAIRRITLNILTIGLYQTMKDTPDEVICSELVARIYSEFGYKLKPNKKYDKVTPEDLRRVIEYVVKAYKVEKKRFLFFGN